MKTYCPFGIGINPRGNIVKLFTYDSCMSMVQAKEAIKVWSKNFKLLSTWIRDNENNILCHTCYVNGVGQISYKGTDLQSNGVK